MDLPSKSKDLVSMIVLLLFLEANSLFKSFTVGLVQPRYKSLEDMEKRRRYVEDLYEKLLEEAPGTVAVINDTVKQEFTVAMLKERQASILAHHARMASDRAASLK